MKIKLHGFEGGFFSSKDLESVVPKMRSGRVLNYGQGEGQVQIDDTVWGVYVGREGEYYLQYEEGTLSPKEFGEYLSDVVEHLEVNFTKSILLDGIHEGDPNV